jgi:replicative DNA helicase
MTAAYPLDCLGDRALPANVEAEKSILGAILLDNRANVEAAQSLSENDFSLDAHRRIFGAMSDLMSANTPIDIVTLGEELDERKVLEAIGGAAYVSSLLDGVPDRPSIAHYVQIVKKKSLLRGLIRAAEVSVARACDGDEPAEVASTLLKAVLDVETETRGSNLVLARDFMPEVLRELEKQAQSGGLVGLPTGLDPLDVVTGGLRPGELVVIGALPSAGKTALASQILAANATAGHHVGVFSIEMSRWDLGKRLLSLVTPVRASKIRHPNNLTNEDWRALAEGAAEVAGWRVWYDDSGTISIPRLLASARLLITRMKVKLIVVDYLQLAQAEGRNIRERVGNVADALRQLAKGERVPVVLLSQLRRPQSVNDVPTLIDLKESGDIEAHAHLVLLLHTPVGPNGLPTGQDTIIVAKNRNGAKGPIPVTLNLKDLRFYPRTLGGSREQAD